MYPASGPGVPVPPFAPVRAPVGMGGPKRTSLWVGLGMLIVGLVLTVVVLGAFAASTLPEDYPVIAVPGRRSVELNSGSTYNLYFEYPGATSQERTPPVVHVTGPTGDDEPLGPPDTVTGTYKTTGGREGRSFASIRPTVSGVYRIDVEAVADGDRGDQMQVTIGREESGLVATVEITGGLLGIGMMVAGTVILIRRVVKRRRVQVPVATTGPVPVPPAPPTPPPAPAVDWSAPDASERVED
jgi:hypothetical protein